jgi:hypothetical protein
MLSQQHNCALHEITMCGGYSVGLTSNIKGLSETVKEITEDYFEDIHALSIEPSGENESQRNYK